MNSFTIVVICIAVFIAAVGYAYEKDLDRLTKECTARSCSPGKEAYFVRKENLCFCAEKPGP